MRIRKTLATILLSGAIALGLAGKSNSASVLYDDFSDSVLDATKWQERLDKSGAINGFIDEHYIDIENQNYHTRQLSASDKGIELKLLRDFEIGEILEFDLFYNSGSGNHWGGIFWDESSNWYWGLTMIGHWNEVDSHSGDLGKYHYKAEFQNEGINLEIIFPNSSKEIYFLANSSPYATMQSPYSPSIVTRTGHNGTAHFDYDNFYTDVIPEPSALALLGLSALGLMRKKKISIDSRGGKLTD